jgi:23S rRNA pseudouridine1911/1915/1917 synthase
MSLNDGFAYTETVSGVDGVGLTVLDYLSDRYRHSTRADWLERILDGRVTLNGARTSARTRLRNGQTITWQRPPWEEPEAPSTFDVLYEDADLLAVAKPAGLPVLPGAGFLSRTLLARVRQRNPVAAPVHRLGRWTSGVVLFGRSVAARRALTEAWRSGEVVKRYRALASGRPESSTFDVDRPIGPVPHPRLGSVHAASDDGKPSRTRVEVIETRPGGFLADVRIDTGRPHQIRIHLAAAGHPLVGDPLYAHGGRPLPACTALPGDPGYHLHAAELRLAHPRTGDLVAIRCSPPPRLRSTAGLPR